MDLVTAILEGEGDSITLFFDDGNTWVTRKITFDQLWKRIVYEEQKSELK